MAGIKKALGETLLEGAGKLFGRQSTEEIAAAAAKKVAQRAEPTLAKDGAQAAEGTAKKNADNGMNFEKTDTNNMGGPKKTFDPRAEKAAAEAAAKAAKEASDAAARQAAEQAAATGGKGADKAVKEALNEKAKASWGEQAKNWINSKFEETNWAVRNLLARPIAFATSKAVSNPVKTVVGADLAINLTSAGINPENPDRSLAYNAAKATVKDVSTATGAVIGTTTSIAQFGAEHIDLLKPTAEWLVNNGKTAAAKTFISAGEALDGAMDQTTKELGIENTLADKKLPNIPGAAGRIATLSHNVAAKARRAGEQALSEVTQNDGADNSVPADNGATTMENASPDLANKGKDAVAIAKAKADALAESQMIEKLEKTAKDHPMAALFGIMGFAGNRGASIGERTMSAAFMGFLGFMLDKFVPGLGKALGSTMSDGIGFLKSQLPGHKEKDGAAPAVKPGDGAPILTPRDLLKVEKPADITVGVAPERKGDVVTAMKEVNAKVQPAIATQVPVLNTNVDGAVVAKADTKAVNDPVLEQRKPAPNTAPVYSLSI